MSVASIPIAYMMGIEGIVEITIKTEKYGKRSLERH
jgi:hypothetical protein